MSVTALKTAAVDARADLLAKVGDLSNFKVQHNQVLVGIYIRPEKTKGGVFLTDNNRQEDVWQGKVALILKKGPTAFTDPRGSWTWVDSMDVGNWVVVRASDAWNLMVNGVHCRLVDDTRIRAKIPTPDTVW